jgi:hypothetical protein
MTELQPAPETKAEARAAEAAAIRRRWITLGEILAVVAVLISALTLWLNWSERTSRDTEKTAESSSRATRAATLTLRAERSTNGKRLDLNPVAEDQVVQSQTIRFPTALDVDPVETTGQPRIEARWFDDALKEAREDAGLPDNSRGDERLPVLIETRFVVDGQNYTDVALYDLGYTIKGEMISGHDLRLRGLSLVRRAPARDQLDSRWQAMMPKSGN